MVLYLYQNHTKIIRTLKHYNVNKSRQKKNERIFLHEKSRLQRTLKGEEDEEEERQKNPSFPLESVKTALPL